MNETLLGLYQLQHIDTQLDELVSSRGELPVRVEEMRAALVERENILAEIERFVHEHQAKVRTLDNDVTDHREKLEKYKKQQFDVKTTREYDAITFQIEDADRRLNEGTETMARLSMELENAQADADAARNDVAQLKEEFDASRKQLEEVMLETAAEEKKLTKLRTDAAKKVTPQFISIYERIRPAKNGLGIVGVRDGVCGGCFNAIPRQLVLELNRGEKHTVCEYCGRIVVGEPIAVAVDGERVKIVYEVDAEEAE